MSATATHIPPAAPAQFTLAVDYSARQRGDQWAVVRDTWFINRHAEKDCLQDDVSLWPTQADAIAALPASTSRKAA